MKSRIEVYVMTEIEVLPQKTVDAKTIILRSRLDANMARMKGEKHKQSFFAKFGFLKPKAEEIRLAHIEKYYEPYIVLGGKYSIDYCKRHIYATKVSEQTGRVFVGGKPFKPETLNLEKAPTRVLMLEGEEHVHYQKETYFVLDRFRREIKPEKLHFAPSEDQTENLATIDCDFRRVNISQEADTAFLRAKIAKRPSDLVHIIRETFDITERSTVYCPVYELTFQNMNSGTEVTLLIDGVSGEMTLFKFNKREPTRSAEMKDDSSFNGDFLVAKELEPLIT